MTRCQGVFLLILLLNLDRDSSRQPEQDRRPCHGAIG